MAKERSARRNQFLDLIGRLDLEFVAIEASLSGLTDPEARTATLTALATHLLDEDVQKWTLDSIDPVERSRDRHDITRVVGASAENDPLQFDHLRSSSEPMLWVADAVAWDATHDRRLEGLRVIEVS